MSVTARKRCHVIVTKDNAGKYHVRSVWSPTHLLELIPGILQACVSTCVLYNYTTSSFVNE